MDIGIRENNRKGAMDSEVDVGPSRPLWIELGNDPSEGKGR
jgi:hypothetical protein